MHGRAVVAFPPRPLTCARLCALRAAQAKDGKVHVVKARAPLAAAACRALMRTTAVLRAVVRPLVRHRSYTRSRRRARPSPPCRPRAPAAAPRLAPRRGAPCALPRRHRALRPLLPCRLQQEAGAGVGPAGRRVRQGRPRDHRQDGLHRAQERVRRRRGAQSLGLRPALCAHATARADPGLPDHQGVLQWPRAVHAPGAFGLQRDCGLWAVSDAAAARASRGSASWRR